MQWAYFMPHEIDVYKLYIISSYASPPIFFNDVKAKKKSVKEQLKLCFCFLLLLFFKKKTDTMV